MTERTEGPDVDTTQPPAYAGSLDRWTGDDAQLPAAALRALVVGLLGLVVAIRTPFPAATYDLLILALFLALGYAGGACARRFAGFTALRYAFATLDLLLLAYALVIPNPLADRPATPQMAIGSGNFGFFFLLLAGALLSYSARLVLWTGLGAALAWIGVTTLLALLPGSVTMFDYADWTNMPLFARVDAMRQPTFVDLAAAVRDIGLIVLVTLLLAAIVRRMRRLAARQTDMELQRADLARYFSPNVVADFTRSPGAFRTGVEQPAAVMFLDIRGFTALAEQLNPHLTLEILRSFHRRMTEAVFAHDGTLDKFIGDGLLVTFGVPKQGPRDVSNAIACALAMRASIRAWSGFRARSEYPAVGFGIGIHFGPVIMGDIGSRERMEFAVIGDTVNIASQLEQLSRKLDTDTVVSDDAVAAAHQEAGPDDPLFDGFREAPEQSLRGRLSGKIVWIYDEVRAREDADRRRAAAELALGAS